MKHVFVFTLLALVLLPFLWIVYAAFLPPSVIYSGNFFSKLGFSLHNVRELAGLGFWNRLGFSLLVSSTVALLQLATSLPAAYALRQGARGLGLFLFLLAIPVELLLVPLYGVLFQLHLLNTPWALILPFAASPFTVFLLYQSLHHLPWELVESARLDGATEGQILRHVLLPLLTPSLIAAGVLAFAAHWNLVLYPRVVVGQEYWTLQVWITNLEQRFPTDWGLLSAAAVFASLPLLILYLAFERRIVDTFEGSVKG